MISVFEANNCLGCFITLEGTKCFSFQGTVEATFEEFNVISNKNNLENSHNIYTKIYLIDISNSKNYINEYLKDKYTQMLYILVGQASASDAKISIGLYFYKPLNGNQIRKSLGENEVSVGNGSYLTTWQNLLYSFCGGSCKQTEELKIMSCVPSFT